MYKFKTPPYKHQLETFELSKDATYHAIIFEQRCGKTKCCIDTAAYRYLKGDIKALLIIAPNLVHLNWARDEIPTHMPNETLCKTLVWQSSKMDSVKSREALDDLLKHKGLSILCVNVDAIVTSKLRDYLTRFYDVKRDVMAVVDESLDISAHDSQRTKMAVKIGQRSKIRRILDGTVADASPLGLYSQCEFLRPGALGFSNFFAFKRRYAQLETKDVGQHKRICPDCKGEPFNCVRCDDTGRVGEREIQVVTGYKRLDELNQKLMAFSSRVTRAQCADMPPKIYQKELFDLTKIQRKKYEDMRKDALAEVRGEFVSAPLALTRLLRLQQITSNHLPVDGGFTPCSHCMGEGCEKCHDTGMVEEDKRVVAVDTETDARADAFRRVIERTGGQGIVWARFKPDVDAAICVLESLGKRVGRYDGSTSSEERTAAKDGFQRGDVDVIVGSARAGGRGIDLSCANFVIYYSQDWSLRMRRQSEDRAQSLKKTESVLYIDLVATDTVDEKVLETLRNNKGFADLVVGDPSLPWL
jgi:SNF2 family DNA or RNA helicase